MTVKPGIIESIFARYKKEFRHTLLWKNANKSTQSLLLKRVKLLVDESPILYYSPSTENGWLLTTENLFIFGDNATRTMRLADIESVELKKLWEETETKIELSSLQLFSKSELINLETEKLSWPVIFKIFHFIV